MLTRWFVYAPIAGLSLCATFPRTQQDEERTAGEKGLPISASAPSFMPQHLTGPHAGKSACPLCVYGAVPQLQIWVQERQLEQGLQFAKKAETLCDENRERARLESRRVAYVIVVPSQGGVPTSTTLSAIRRAECRSVFFVQVPSWEDAQTSGLYGHSTKDQPGLRLYSIVNRRVFQRWDEPAIERWPEIAERVEQSAHFVALHEVTDSQIAPAWEPGQRLEIEFHVVDARQKPLRRVRVSAMQADATGLYNPQGWNRRDPRLAALAWTDEQGKITFRTIMPGAYPRQAEPAHVHLKALVGGRPEFRTLWFEGDPLLTVERREWAERDAETVIVPLERNAERALARHTFVIAD